MKPLPQALSGEIAMRGGRTRVARALGVTYLTVRAWALGHQAPSRVNHKRLMELPPAPPLRPGCPKREHVVPRELLDRAIALHRGSQNATAFALRVDPTTLRRWKLGVIAIPVEMGDRLRAMVAERQTN